MSDTQDHFTQLEQAAATGGTAAMLEALTRSLATRRRWHSLFDARLLQARTALGLPPVGDMSSVPEAVRQQLEDRSVAACREVGWPLLDEGHVAAAWMYLRAAAEPADVAARLAELAQRIVPTADEDDEETARRLQELVGITLWEGVDPALGLSIVLQTQGTCNSITAYEQAVSRLPAGRQAAAAAVLVDHLSRDIATNLAADLERRGTALPAGGQASIVALLEAAGGLENDPSVHVDVSHLQSVLRIARVTADPAVVQKAWELACYGCRLPAEVVYPGEPPFEDVAKASRLFFGSQLGHDVNEAITYFRKAAVAAGDHAGTLPCDTLVLLLWRLSRPAEALHAALGRPHDDGMSGQLQIPGLLPSLVELAAASGEWHLLRRACRERGDEITFAAAVVAELAAKGSPPPVSR
jgi:hypothetical protein